MSIEETSINSTLESAPEIHLSANGSDTDSQSSINEESPLLRTSEIETESSPISSSTSQTSCSQSSSYSSAFDGGLFGGYTKSEDQCSQTDENVVQPGSPRIVQIKIDLLPNLQMILFYLIVIFSTTYSIYRIVAIFSPIIPVEFFFMILIGIFGFLNFDCIRPCSLPF